MLKRIQWDIYTMLIVAIVPVFLAVTWGLTWNYERATAARACEDTETYLSSVTGAASMYTDAGTLANIDAWLNHMETIQPQGHGEDLHEAGIRAIEYASTTDPGLDTTVPGAVYDETTPFQSSLDEAYDVIAEECPELEAMLPEAFPMFYKEQ